MSVIEVKSVPMQLVKREDLDQKVLMIFLGVMAVLVTMGLLFLDVAVPFLKSYSVPANALEETEEDSPQVTVNV